MSLSMIPGGTSCCGLIEERPQASFYHAVPEEDVVVVYCRDEDFGIWILPGSGMGPLDETGKLHIKEAITLDCFWREGNPAPGSFSWGNAES